MSLLFDQISHATRDTEEAPAVAPSDLPIFLRVNNGDNRSFRCTLIAVAKGQFHLSSKYYFNEGLNVIVSFGLVDVPGVVLSSIRQEKSTLLYVAINRAESRADPRFPINRPGRLIVLTQNNAILLPCVLADISRTGMGVRVLCAVEAGQTAYLETDAALVISEIRHCLPTARTGEFRAGLRIIDIMAGTRPKLSRFRSLAVFCKTLWREPES